MKHIIENKKPYVVPVVDSVMLDNTLLAGSGSLESGGTDGNGGHTIPASAKGVNLIDSEENAEW